MDYMVRVRAAAVLIHEGKILLNEVGGGNHYNFPGGGLEEGETVKEAVAREVFEEAGLTVDVGDLVFALEYGQKSRDYRDGESRRISLFFRCFLNTEVPPQIATLPDIDPYDSTNISEAKWFSVEEIGGLNNLLPPVYEPLINYIKTGVFTPVFVETHYKGLTNPCPILL